MTDAVAEPIRVSTQRYFQLTECGITSPDDRVELLEGMIVSMAAQSAPHASTVYGAEHALPGKLPPGTVVRTTGSQSFSIAAFPEAFFSADELLPPALVGIGA